MSSAFTAVASHGLLVFCLVVACSATPASAGPVTTADEVCAPTDDPCIVTERIEIAPGARLDFGLRDLRVTGDGRLEAPGSARILCGAFEADSHDAALVSTGSLSLDARRKCSDESTEIPCTDNRSCNLGTCSAFRCEGDSMRLCSGDASCQLGPCLSSGRCSGSADSRCSTNTDCDLGSCGSQLTCEYTSYFEPIECSTNSDCFFGTCSVGDAPISLRSRVIGRGEDPAVFDLRAADSILIDEDVLASGVGADSDGGWFDADSSFGDIVVNGKVRARSGRNGGGGVVWLWASTGSIEVNAPIDVTGGDFDGGHIDLDAGGDIRVLASLRASSNRGAGYGGDITVFSSGNVEVGSDDIDARPLRLDVSGNSKQETGGDGGGLDVVASEDVSVHANVRVRANGAPPDSEAGEIVFDALGSLVVAADVKAVSRQDGAGGSLWLGSNGQLTVDAEADFDLRGGRSGGGDLHIETEDDARIDGRFDLRGDVEAGMLELVSTSGTVSIGGTIQTGGTQGSDFLISACRLRLLGGSRLENAATSFAASEITVGESMSFSAGSTLLTPHGSNTLTYRTALKPPVLAGTVSPSPILIEDSGLAGCPVCGNSEIDELETCDDGNTAPGDGCSETCQVE